MKSYDATERNEVDLYFTDRKKISTTQYLPKKQLVGQYSMFGCFYRAKISCISIHSLIQQMFTDPDCGYRVLFEALGYIDEERKCPFFMELESAGLRQTKQENKQT